MSDSLLSRLGHIIAPSLDQAGDKAAVLDAATLGRTEHPALTEVTGAAAGQAASACGRCTDNQAAHSHRDHMPHWLATH